MDFRTDLALERHEMLAENDRMNIKHDVFCDDEVEFTKIVVDNERSAEILDRPLGTYITVEIPSLVRSAVCNSNIINAIARQVKSLLPRSGAILVAGLGNDEITPDAVGIKTASMILATRHIDENARSQFGFSDLRDTAVITPGVLGKTGIEACETIIGVTKSVKPSAVIVVDALAAHNVSRLGRTIQITDTGIIPGSGVGNSRMAINSENLGVPVISIGIPTVVDAKTLVNNLTDSNAEIKNAENKGLIVTPREIDLVVQRSAEIIALSINRALQPSMSVEELLMLVGN